MKKTIILFTLSFLITSSSFSQSKFSKKKKKTENTGYNITGEIIGLQDTAIILAYYFGDKQYAADTAQSINGKFSFQGDKALKGGMYLVVLPHQKYFDIIISEQEFSFRTELGDIYRKMSFTNSEENTAFYTYLNFITEKQKIVSPLRAQLESGQQHTKKEVQKKIDKIDTDVKKYTSDFINNHPNKFFSKILIASTPPEIPESPLDSTGKPDIYFPSKYYKKHFWDNIDFSDARMLRTRIFHQQMTTYLEKLTATHPDSINISADILVKYSRENKEIFKYVVSHITSTYERSKIMGMDAVFVHMVESYYITQQCDWIDSTQLAKIIERAEKIAPNLIGKKASEFLDFYGRPFMKDPEGVTHTLAEIEADYTTLIFFGPTCGHCKKEMPKVKHKLDSLTKIGIDIKTFVVATEFDKNAWKEFISEQNTGSWLNVADINHDKEGNPVASSDWRDKYDIYSTPVIYLLDKEKRIIAKRITHEQLAEIIGRLENLKKE